MTADSPQSIDQRLPEDEEDLAAFAERAGETSLSYAEFLVRLKADGVL